MLIDGKVTKLPTEPWATQARYVPGQVYCPAHVDRDDVNPRPLSPLVPSHGLIGCFSGDAKWIMASAWEPYQELFQGVITCVHSDFRLGGLKPGETKQNSRPHLPDARRHRHACETLRARFSGTFSGGGQVGGDPHKVG